MPTGTDSSGILGSPARMALNFSSSSPRRASDAFSSSPSAPTCAMTSEASLPCPFNMPICFDRLLRCACRSCVRVCSVLRSASSALNSLKSIGLPRLARPSATASRLERSCWMSSMDFPVFRRLTATGGRKPEIIRDATAAQAGPRACRAPSRRSPETPPASQEIPAAKPASPTDRRAPCPPRRTRRSSSRTVRARY